MLATPLHLGDLKGCISLLFLVRVITSAVESQVWIRIQSGESAN